MNRKWRNRNHKKNKI